MAGSNTLKVPYQVFLSTPSPIGGPTPEESLEETLKSILRGNPNMDVAEMHAAVSKACAAVAEERAAAKARAYSKSEKKRSGGDGGVAVGLACGLF